MSENKSNMVCMVKTHSFPCDFEENNKIYAVKKIIEEFFSYADYIFTSVYCESLIR
jgi:hypothetical protein